MKKTIDEILNRNDYQRLTEKLRERVEDIAGRIRVKMEELDIPTDDDFLNGEIGFRDVVVRVAHYSYYDNYYETLTIKVHNEYGAYWHTLERVGREKGYDTQNDGHIIDGRATNNEYLAFLNVARDLIEGLEEIEEKKTEAIQKALSDTFFLEEEK